jgi:hypothetical protein
MDSQKFQFRLEGAGAEEAAEEMAALIQRDLGITPEKFPARVTDENTGTRTDPIALAALILAIPSAVLATVELIERIRNKEKLDRLIEQSRKLQKKHSTTRIRIITPKGKVIELENITSSEMLDIAAEEKEKK